MAVSSPATGRYQPVAAIVVCRTLGPTDPRREHPRADCRRLFGISVGTGTTATSQQHIPALAERPLPAFLHPARSQGAPPAGGLVRVYRDRKSTRLNSSP